MKQRFSIIKKAPLWLGLGVILSAVAMTIFFQNMRNHFSIQFTGGIEMVVDQKIDAPSFKKELTQALQAKKYQDFVVHIGTKDGYDSILLQIDLGDDEQVTTVTQLVEQVLLDTKTITTKDQILEMSIIGPSIGDYIRKTAKNAIIRGIVLMAVYILFAFAGMRMLISPVLL